MSLYWCHQKTPQGLSCASLLFSQAQGGASLTFAFQLVDATQFPDTLIHGLCYYWNRGCWQPQSQWAQSGLQMGDSESKYLFKFLINTHKAWPQWASMKEQMQTTGESKPASLPKRKESKRLHIKGWDMNKVCFILKQTQMYF